MILAAGLLLLYVSGKLLWVAISYVDYRFPALVMVAFFLFATSVSLLLYGANVAPALFIRH